MGAAGSVVGAAASLSRILPRSGGDNATAAAANATDVAVAASADANASVGGGAWWQLRRGAGDADGMGKNVEGNPAPAATPPATASGGGNNQTALQEALEGLQPAPRPPPRTDSPSSAGA